MRITWGSSTQSTRINFWVCPPSLDRSIKSMKWHVQLCLGYCHECLFNTQKWNKIQCRDRYVYIFLRVLEEWVPNRTKKKFKAMKTVHNVTTSVRLNYKQVDYYHSDRLCSCQTAFHRYANKMYFPLLLWGNWENPIFWRFWLVKPDTKVCSLQCSR